MESDRNHSDSKGCFCVDELYPRTEAPIDSDLDEEGGGSDDEDV
jgi:hypothetical protein